MAASKAAIPGEETFTIVRCDTVHASIPRQRSKRDRGIWVLLLLAVVLFGVRLPCALLEPEEARHAEIARQMLVEGRWLTPILDGEDYLHKPPLFYWLIMASYLLFGVHDWAARLVVCLAGIGTAGACYYWARARLGRRVAWLSVLVLLLSGRFLYLQGMVLFDSLLCLWVTLAWWLGDRALQKQGFSWALWLGSAAACGLGVMTKGPVAGVLILPSLLFLQWRIGFTFQTWKRLGAFVCVAAFLAGPWFAYLAWTHPEAAREFFLLHHVQRFVDPIDHAKPWWFYLPALLTGMLPWSLWFVPALRRGIQTCRQDGLARVLKGRTAPFWFAGLWCVLFFSLSGCKRAAYVLPAFGPLSIALAYRVSATSWFKARREAGFTRLGMGILMSCFVAFLGASLFWLPAYHDRFGMRDALVPIQQEPEWNVYCYPRSWNSVTFYLERRVETTEVVAELMEALREQECCWLIVRRRDGLREVMKDWPESLEFHKVADHPNVIVGRVRQNQKSPSLPECR